MAEKEHIEREAVTEKLSLLRDKCGNDEMAFALNWALRLMNDIPAADVEPVRYGKWVHPVPGDGEPYCSVCKAEAEYFPGYGTFEPERCPRCGAKMDGRADNG